MTAKRRLAEAELQVERAAAEARAGGWSVVFERAGVIYDRHPWEPEARRLTDAELEALEGGEVVVIEYVDHWRSESGLVIRITERKEPEHA